MNYPFYCPNCGANKIISMPIKEMTNDGHICDECGTELKREISSMVCGVSIDKTNSFYRKCN